jgi:hypothetical protein
MFLLKRLQENNTEPDMQAFQRVQYELVKKQIIKEQLLNEQKGILHTLEIYYSLITYIFYIAIFLSFLFVVISVLSRPFKKLTKFLWNFLLSDMFLVVVGVFVIMIGFMIMGITMYEILYETYLWHNNKLKYFENLTERELKYTHERNYL